MNMTLQQIATWVNGTLLGAEVPITGVTIDSRAVQPGDVFVAIVGDNFDGHQFLPMAQEKGAVAAVVAHEQDVFSNAVSVADTREALGLLATGWAQQCAARHIAITGNSGKTTVKEMLAHLFSEASCLATAGNFNNEIGVPLTLLRLNEQHEYGIFELGANHQGEIAWTASLVAPEVGVITNVTGAHLEGFGTLAGIAAAKAEIIAHVRDVLVLNKNGGFYDTFAEAAQQADVTTITVSHDGQAADFQAQRIECLDEAVRFQCWHEGEAFSIELPLPGEHQVANSLQAIAVARHYQLPWAHIQQKFATLPSVPGRLQRKACGAGVLLDDSYNANPGSVAAAIRYLATQPAPRLFVFGGMGELGAASAEEHQRIGELAKAKQIDELVVVGELAGPALSAFGEGATQCSTNSEAALQALRILQLGGSVLVKGSRSAQLETVVADVLAQYKEAN